MVIIEAKNLNKISFSFTGKTYCFVYFYRNTLVKEEFTYISYMYLKNNKIHRYYGPAKVYNKNKGWYFYGKCLGFSNDYNQKQFLKDLNKQWLL